MQGTDLPTSVDRTTRALLICGLVAGPLFTLSWLVQGPLRTDYDPMAHAISSLSAGEGGWVQIATFVITGALTLVFAVGLWRKLRPARALWGPLLIGLLGVGLIGAGIFVSDPLAGYPPGTPLIPTERTAHGILHDLFGIPFFLGLPISCVIFWRYFRRWGERGWAIYSLLTGIGMFAAFFVARLSLRPGFEAMAGTFGLFQRVTVTLGWAWLTLLALHMLRSGR
jgi:hypothetical protein